LKRGEEMKYIAKLYTTEQELLSRVGFDPETSVITNIEFKTETGEIELLIRSMKDNEFTSENSSLDVRRYKI